MAPQTWNPPSLRCSGHPPVLASATDHIHDRRGANGHIRDRRTCGVTWIPRRLAASGISPVVRRDGNTSRAAAKSPSGKPDRTIDGTRIILHWRKQTVKNAGRAPATRNGRRLREGHSRLEQANSRFGVRREFAYSALSCRTKFATRNTGIGIKLLDFPVFAV